MMNYWFKKGIDVIALISKKSCLPDGKTDSLLVDSEQYSSGPRVHEFLQELNREVMSKYDCMTVGECPNVTFQQAIDYTNPDNHELNMVFQFELMEVDASPVSKFHLVPFDLVKIKHVQTRWQKGLEGKGWNSIYLSNHDQPRPVSRFGNDSPE